MKDIKAYRADILINGSEAYIGCEGHNSPAAKLFCQIVIPS
jgi:hypothetical protein